MSTPIIPWMGGKRRLAKAILPHFPEHQCYVEPFCGGAAMLFAKAPVRTEVINDYDGELVNLYRVVKHHLAEFVTQFRNALVSRQIFEWHKMTPPETLTDIQRAARFFYLQKMAFGGKTHGRTFGTSTTTAPRLNLLRIEEDLSQAHLRLARVLIENMDWARCIDRYDRPHTLFYLDPPYFETAGYGREFAPEHYARLAEKMQAMAGHAVLSINDHPQIRHWFADFPIAEVDIRYTVSGAHRSKAARELIISNRPIAA